jgi:F1F0 ATPase subunit 2
MTMHETLRLAGLAGGALGAVFFGGLWWTVRRGVASKRPALLFTGSLLLRSGVAMGGFYVVGGGHWQRLLACCIGFAMARLVVTRLTGAPRAHHPLPDSEAGHAP